MPHGPDTTRDGQSRGDRNLNPADFHFSVHPESLEVFEAESHDEFRIRTFHGDKYVAGADYFTDDYDEVQAMVNDPASRQMHQLPDPTTDHAVSEQADYDQHLEDTGEEEGW
jgi:hypothetical protein